MNTIQYGPVVTETPSKFDECTPEQFVYIAQLLRRGLERNDVLIRVACKYSGIPLQNYFLIPRIQQMEIEDQFLWIWEDFTMEKWMIKKIQAGKKTLWGPVQRLSNIIGEEFPVIDYYFSKYNKSKSQEDLFLFIASLYRPTGKGVNPRIDIREELYDQELPERAKEIALCNTNECYAIYLNYIGVRALMEKSYPNLFSGGSGGRSKGWDTVYANLARSGLGSMESVGKLSIWNILGILENDIIEFNERERNAGK